MYNYPFANKCINVFINFIELRECFMARINIYVCGPADKMFGNPCSKPTDKE